MALWEPSEFAMHCAVAEALERGAAPGWLHTHFPAGENRDRITGALLKKMGLKRGWPDLLLISPIGLHYWLELKKGKAALSSEQRAFHDAMLERHVPCRVARSVDEALAILRGWGALRLRVSA